jgi:selenophosphate synthetase-related protein
VKVVYCSVIIFVVDDVIVLGGIAAITLQIVDEGYVQDVSTFLFEVGGVGSDFVLDLLTVLSLLGMGRKGIYDVL